MEKDRIVGIDQSTQGTKALLFDACGNLLAREDLPHKQWIDARGYVEHDPEEIYANTIRVVNKLIERTQTPGESLAGIGISNQRETIMAWDKTDGKPVSRAIVWQCGRGTAICEELTGQGVSGLVKKYTGLPLSPYFSAAKLSWILQNVEGARELADSGRLCAGTMDSWLIYRLTGGKRFATDYSNACRTQLFNIHSLSWDEEICRLFRVPSSCLPQVLPSDSCFGQTDLDGCLPHPIPIHAVLGDSHAALFGQGCLTPGMAKATYGTGSSIMLHVGDRPVSGGSGAASSLAWHRKGKAEYVLEGNINYTGAVISWLIQDLKLIDSAEESERLAYEANPEDTACLVPAFTGLGAPWWDSGARASLSGMSRTTGKAEIVRAALESIAFQIRDVVEVMRRESGLDMVNLRVDGGPTRNRYLMQFQSDLLRLPVEVPEKEELSGIGAAYMAGTALGLYQEEPLFSHRQYREYLPRMAEKEREERVERWGTAVQKVLTGK